MNRHLSNAAYGVLDYAAYPLGMLLVAPVVLHHMGAAQYGAWMIVVAAISLGSIVGSGFGDANIQQVAAHRGAGELSALIETVRAMVGIHLVFGTALAFLLWMLAPFVARHAITQDAAAQRDFITALRLACVVMWARIQETVPVSTQRAFERYASAVHISVLTRVLSLLGIAVLAMFTKQLAPLIAVTAVLSLVGTAVQFSRVNTLLGSVDLRPSFRRETLAVLLSFGIFSWLQATAGVLFSQADRLLLGISKGAVIVAAYALCAQLAQPVYGLASAGLHFVFPLLARRGVLSQSNELRRIVLMAAAANLGFVLLASGVLLLCGPSLLRLWAGPEVARAAQPLLPLLVLGSSLLALNVTATYALFALARVQPVTWLNLLGGALMLAAMVALIHRGPQGLAVARLCYGAVTLLLYIPLARALRQKHASSETPQMLQPAQVDL